MEWAARCDASQSRLCLLKLRTPGSVRLVAGARRLFCSHIRHATPGTATTQSKPPGAFDLHTARIRNLRPARFPSLDLAVGYFRNKVRDMLAAQHACSPARIVHTMGFFVWHVEPSCRSHHRWWRHRGALGSAL
jgi:hypothetical protein